MADARSLSVPDGLEGERLDAALARLFGFSRTKAADLVVGGAVTVDGRESAQSDRVHAGAWLEVTMPDEAQPVVDTQPMPGRTIVFDDEDIVVVDKPVGVAA